MWLKNVLCGFAAATLLLCGEARAQTPAAPAATEPPAGYHDAITGALAEFDAGHFEEARSLFARAHAIYPNARTLRGLGVVEFELRNYAPSAEYLTQALASQEKPLEGELRKATEQALARSKGFLGNVLLTVEPATARVIIDGTPVEFTPGQALLLQVGDHVLEIQAEGYTAEKHPLSIKGGDAQSLQVTLQSLLAGSSAPIDASREKPAGRAGPWPWVVVGISGALVVTGGVLVVMAQHDISTVEDAKKGTAWPQLKSAYDAAPGKSAAGFALLGVGAAGVAAGLLWHFVWDAEPSERMQVSFGDKSVMLSGKF